MTQSYVWHDLFIRVTWHGYVCDMTHSKCDVMQRGVLICVPRHDTFMCVTWHVYVCDVSRLCVWHDTFMCVTWHVYVCDMTHLCVWHDSPVSVMWFDVDNSGVLMCVPCVWQETSMCVTWHIYECDMTRICVWYDTFTCVTWLTGEYDVTQRWQQWSSGVCDMMVWVTWRAVCIYICIFACIYIYVYTYTYINIYMYVCVCTWHYELYVYTYAYMYVCIYVYIHKYIYVCVCVYMTWRAHTCGIKQTYKWHDSPVRVSKLNIKSNGARIWVPATHTLAHMLQKSSHATHTSESCRTFEWCMSHICDSLATHIRTPVLSHVTTQVYLQCMIGVFLSVWQHGSSDVCDVTLGFRVSGYKLKCICSEWFVSFQRDILRKRRE